MLLHWSSACVSFAALMVVTAANGSPPICYVSTSSILRLGQKETVHVSAPRSLTATQMIARLRVSAQPGCSASSCELWKTTETVSPGREKTVEFQLNATKLSPCNDDHQQEVYLSTTCELGSEILRLEEQKIPVNCAFTSILVQLDKPVYSPRQTVHIRVFLVDENLHMFPAPITLKIRNPQGVLMGSTTASDDQIAEGVLEQQFHLDSEPQFGFWSVEAQSLPADNHAGVWMYGRETFEVKDYVLPRFGVAIVRPNFIRDFDTEFCFRVRASYSYGKSVNGTVTATLSVMWNNVRMVIKRWDPEELVTPLTNKGDSKTAAPASEKIFHISMREITEELPYKSFPYDGCALIKAEVIERSSQKRAHAVDRSSCFVRDTCRFDCSLMDSVFKPGLSYNSKLFLKDINGKVLGGQPVSVRTTQEAGENNVVTEAQVTSREDGAVFISLSETLADATALRIQATANCTSQATLAVVLPCPVDPVCGDRIYVVSSSRTGTVKDNLQVSVKVTQKRTKNRQVFLLVVARNRVIGAQVGSITAGFLEAVFTVFIKETWSPGVFFLAYIPCEQGCYLADSVYQEIERHVVNDVSVEFVVQPGLYGYNPGEVQEIIISAQGGSTVYLLAVDQSVYYLNSSRSLSQTKVFNMLQHGETGCRRRSSCDASSAFQAAGLNLIQGSCPGSPPLPARCSKAWCARITSDGRPTLSSAACCGRAIQFMEQFPARRHILTCDREAQKLPGPPRCKEIFRVCCRAHVIELSRRRWRNNNHLARFFSDVNTVQFIDRRHFPQSVLHRFRISRNQRRIFFQIPDTITTWIMQAVAVHPSHRFAVSSDVRFTVHQQLFLELQLPQMLVDGEQVAMRVIVHNAKSESSSILVYLHGSESGAFCSFVGSGQRTSVNVTVGPLNSVVVTFVLTPLQPGPIEIKVRAVDQNLVLNSDSVVKTLYVKPRGIQVTTQCDSFTLAPQDHNVERYNFKLTLPKDYVFGTVRPLIILTGSLLGSLSSLEGLDKLLDIPKGCGEQNLMIFAVNTFVLRYLQRSCTNRDSDVKPLTRKIRDNALLYMRLGYQRQMNYQRPDGSFSAYGVLDRVGSVWLTAFVLKSFCGVPDGFVSDIPIDPAVIKKATHWLGKRQRSDGSFHESGVVFDRCQTGGVNTFYAPEAYQLTAFVTVAMLECSRLHPSAQEPARKGLRYLFNNIGLMVSSFDVAITSYALSLSGNTTMRSRARERLKQFLPDMPASRCRHGFVYTNRSCTAVELEAGTYALLAQLHLGTAQRCGQCIVDWIMRWRRPTGAFVSTQDTVLALQALTEHLCCRDVSSQDLTVNVSARTASGGRSPSVSLHFDDTNSNQARTVAECEGRPSRSAFCIDNFKRSLFVNVLATGTGSVQVQRCLRYNIEQDERGCNFSIIIHLIKGHCHSSSDNDGYDEPCHMSMTVRVKLLSASMKTTGMAIIDIELLSGFEVDPEQLPQLEQRENVRRREIHDRSVVFYVNQITHTEMTIDLRLRRTTTTGMLQPAVVKVYDYYNPGISCYKFYHLSPDDSQLSVLCHKRKCYCGAGRCMPCPKNRLHVLARQPDAMVKKVCNNDYAWKVRVFKIKPKDGWSIIRMRIDAVIKPGTRDVQRNSKVTFYRPKHCECPKLKLQQKYLVSGPDRGLRLVLDDHTNLEEWNRSRQLCHFFNLMKTPGICDSINNLKPIWKQFKATHTYQICQRRDH